MGLIIFPAIDLRNGQVGRRRQGDPTAQTIFGHDPVAVAQRWTRAGAEWLHIVNLDGAFGDAGDMPINLQRLAEIRAAVDLPIQFGGGLRTVADVARTLELGVSRVVLGTVAVRQPEIVATAIAQFGPEQIVIGIDARDGRVATHGWQETSALGALTVAQRMRDLGASRVVYTDIARDGMLSGVNVAATASLAQQAGLRIIASGGVAGLDDIRALAVHRAAGIEGVITGQALYTGTLDLAQAIAAGRGTEDARP